ncbi:hemin-degrading factor [Paenalcaligenes niemegkensis]|uniref:hemin-degrading factor n=1 Tax=Paenalcaligenes niemegkensis TaxID=2895469 RepID=UPI001EE95ECC|nr:ChuX/HutX family heme-like substrate-binding protein [Paenalcaligenes niemegkensis]MCQ9616156.1 hemin-degrading factor [Paenalcaligenes niemegkensis]
MHLASGHEAQALRTRYSDLKAQDPKARIRTLAEKMAVSEMELVAAGCGDIQSTLLREPAQDIFKELGSLGRVMALTRNPWCVHERHGRYEEIRAGKTMGIVLGPDIDLRLFFANWKSTWAVNDNGRQSIQFFDKAGGALHKVYCTGETDMEAYRLLVEKYTDTDAVWPEPQALPDKKTETVTPDALPLRTDWLALKDTHEFHGLLQKHKASRLDALAAVGTDLAQEVAVDTAERMLQAVARQNIAFMCFVGNGGLIQIHSGPISQLRRTGPWFNVLDPHFNLHLDTTAIASSWIVNKPSKDGWVTSLECYADNGEMIAQFFGARKPGVPELHSWRQLMVSFCPFPLAA